MSNVVYPVWVSKIGSFSVIETFGSIASTIVYTREKKWEKIFWALIGGILLLFGIVSLLIGAF